MECKCKATWKKYNYESYQ